MAREKWIFKEVKSRQGKGPPWLKARKGDRQVYYLLRHDPKTDEVRVFRNGHFSLPCGTAPDNPKLEGVALAATAEELTGEYIDFLLEGSEERFQTTRSLLEEVFEGKNPRKPQKKKVKKKKATGYEIINPEQYKG